MVLIASYLGCHESYANTKIDDLVNKNLSKLEITNYEWTNKSMNSQPIFDVIEIQNNSSIGFLIYYMLINKILHFTEINAKKKFEYYSGTGSHKEEFTAIYLNKIKDFALAITFRIIYF